MVTLYLRCAAQRDPKAVGMEAGKPAIQMAAGLALDPWDGANYAR